MKTRVLNRKYWATLIKGRGTQPVSDYTDVFYTCSLDASFAF